MSATNKRCYRLPFSALAAAATVFAAGSAMAKSTSFQTDVFPIIEKHCLECHQPGGEGFNTSGLDLRSWQGLMKGTKYGPIVVPGSGSSSNLMILIEGLADPSIGMPHNLSKIEKKKRNVIRRWINEGAMDN